MSCWAVHRLFPTPHATFITAYILSQNDKLCLSLVDGAFASHSTAQPASLASTCKQNVYPHAVLEQNSKETGVAVLT